MYDPDYNYVGDKHRIFLENYVTPTVAIDPAKDFYGRVQDVSDYLDVDCLGAADAKNICSNGGHTVPPAVPESDPVLMQRRRDVLTYLVRDVGESLIDTASRAMITKDRWTDDFMHRQRWRFQHLRFALLFHHPRRSIRRFPSEILMLIFEAALDLQDDADNFGYNAIVAALAGTCQMFRKIVLETRPFWTRFHTFPKALPFFQTQLQVLTKKRSRDPILLDIALHRRNHGTPLAAGADRQKVERFKLLISEVAHGLTVDPTTSNVPFTRCVRLRLWANQQEWNVLSGATRLVRNCVAPGLRHIEVDILEATRPLPVPPQDRWLRFLGSTSLRVLRFRCIAGLWDWPASIAEASPLSNLRVLELHTLGALGPRLSHYHAMFSAATDIQAFRLFNTAIRMDPGEFSPVTLPALVELGFNTVEITGLQGLFKMLRVPNLDRMELRDIAYDNAKADFLSTGALTECAQLTDLRMHNVSFNAPFNFDVRSALLRWQNLRHFSVGDLPVQFVQAMGPCLLDPAVTPALRYYYWNYSGVSEDNYVKDGRSDAFNELDGEMKEKRPSVTTSNCFDNTLMRFGRPFADYTKAPKWDAE